MTEPGNTKVSGLFEVREAYSRKHYYYLSRKHYYYHQDKALQIIAGTYVFMFEAEDIPDAPSRTPSSISTTTSSLPWYPGARQPRPIERGRGGAGRPLQRRLHGAGHQPTRPYPRELAPPLPQRGELYLDSVEDSRVVIRGLESMVLGSALEEIVESASGS